MSASQLLMAFRAACAPLIFVLACFDFQGPLLAGVLVAGFLSDVADGLIARRTDPPVPGLRYADTLVDTVFYAVAGAALAVAVPAAFDGAGLLLVVLVTIHVSRATFEVTKYGRVASYHMSVRAGARRPPDCCNGVEFRHRAAERAPHPCALAGDRQ